MGTDLTRALAAAAGTHFYLGTHHPHWLGQTDVPLFVSRRALERYKTLPRARGAWALDSGGFTELAMFGEWRLSVRDYAGLVRRFRDEIGGLAWAAPQDWMCEPNMLKRTGLSVAEHQRRTVANYLELQQEAPDLPWVPVLQGWSCWDYHEHVEAYGRAGVDVTCLPLTGIGTVCRRQHTMTAAMAIASLAADGVKLHGFGFKMQGLEACARHLVSADSLAWSYSARRNPPLPGHVTRHKNCANCIDYALDWRSGALAAVERGLRQQVA
jgi:hypothetical protein